MYPDAQRQRPRSLHFQSSPLVTESAFHDYRHTTPPHSPASTPQTPQVAPFLYGAASPLGTPTSAVNHHHPLSPGAAGAWGSGSRRQSVHMRAPLRNQAEMEENRLKRATWHAGAEEIVGIVGSMEQANLDDPRPKTRQRASTYIPAATPPDIPIVRPVLEEQTPRTLPPIQPWNFGANPLRLPDKRPGMIGAGREHSRSRSASHILNLSEISAPRGYTDSVAEQRGQRPSLSAQRPRLSVAPRGPNADPNAIFSPALKHARRESFEAVSLPRPMEPHIGSSLLGNRARHSTGNPFSGVPGSDPYKQHRYSSHEGSWDHARMNTIESQVFESRPLEAKAIPLDYLANICTEKIEEDKRQQANHLSSQHSHAKQ
ncbi:hypothetical protein DFH27DRAFT_567104 [Peziza echinospora]|nr:hypothetical protein DFH27DRAFT_567104 [Peziza echinospora]